MALLRTEGLTKNFGGLVAVDKLGLYVNQGEILGLIGPNGAGKSTVFNLITAYLSPTSGKIFFEDEDVTDSSTHHIADKGIIRTFQQNTIFMDIAVHRNLLISQNRLCKSTSWGQYFYTRTARREEEKFRGDALKILELFGLIDLKDEIAKNLPHGHQRLLGGAIGMAAKPKLLLLDEPFTGMHPRETQTAMKLVRELQNMGLTIILVEHNMRAVMEICERVTVINFGKKIAEGTPKEIQENEKVIEAYLGKEEEF